MKTFKLLLVGSLVAFFTQVSAQPSKSEADAALGVWLTGNGKAKVEIYKCANKYCGKIVWLREPFEDDGSPKLDDENPVEKLRSRQIMGMKLMKDFVYDEDFEWEDGEIYDAESGKTYSCLMEFGDDQNTLEVRGYIGFSLIGRTDVWTRSSLD